MKKSIASNYLYNLAYQILVIMLPIITTPYLARTLGPEGTGTYSYTISIVTYFILFGSLGIAMYGQREIAFYQDNKKKKTNIFISIVILRSLTMSISMIIFYYIFARTGEFSIYYRILLLEMLANIIDISWFYQGIEEFKKTACRNIFVKLLSVVCIFIFIKGPNDIYKYISIYVATTLLGNLALWINIKNYIDKISFKNLNLKRHLKSTIVLFIPQIAIQIYTVLDKTMIGAILNDMTEVGYYEQSQKIIKILLTIITSLGTVMMPRVAKCYAEGKSDEIKEYMYKTFRFVFFLAFPMIFGIVSVSKDFIPLFLGEGYEPVIKLTNISSIIILFIGFSNVTGTQYLLATKKQKEFTISVIFGAIVNAILNYILIPKFKSLGACIGTIFAELIVSVVQVYFIRKDFNINKIFKSALVYIVYSIIVFVVSCFISNIISSTIVSICVQIIISSIVYLGILYVKKDIILQIIKNRG
ncbi:MAG: flippase [Clostridiales bacterium]|nr:flippase [Clostridiales bacterium]